MKIQNVQHTADVGLKLESRTLKKLFSDGVLGMSMILKEGICQENVRFDKKIRIEIRSLDYTCLLIDFLSEILSVSYSDKSVFCKVDILHLSEKQIIADIIGTSIDHFDEEIKAVTYHEAHVRKNSKNNWETNIIFDI